MKITQRQVVLALFSLQIVSSIGTVLALLVNNGDRLSLISTGVSVFVLGMLLYAYLRGWDYARHVAVIFTTITIGIVVSEPYLIERFSITTFIPAVLAMVMSGPIWVFSSTAVLLAILMTRAGFVGVYADPYNLIICALIVGGMVLARLVSDSAQRAAEEHAGRAEKALVRSEQQALELGRKAEELKEQNEHQKSLLDLVATLETPAVSLADGVLLAPVVGHLDSRRAEALTSRLLYEVNTHRSWMVILDIAGVSTVDTAVAQALMRAAQALRLLGCQVTITGIAASVAITMTQLGVNLEGVSTARTPQEALAKYVPIATGKPELIKNGNGVHARVN